MLRILLLAAVVVLSGCSDETAPASGSFSVDVRQNFLTSCVENAAATAGDRADEGQLAATCECILRKVEQEYDEAAFADFEQRLLDGSAGDAESAQLEQWSTSCAQESAG